MFNYELENSEYEDLQECVKDVYKLASKQAIIGVNLNNGGPFGAGIIYKKENGRYIILTVDSNSVIKAKDPTAHAEINVIRNACKILNTESLENCILVSTAKSCPMCLSAACWANIPIIYYSESYDKASLSGFKDKDILEYLNGNESKIINEIRLVDDFCAKPFEVWDKKDDKIQY